jgi:TolB protein
MAHAQMRVEIEGVGATQLPIALSFFRGETDRLPSPAVIVRSNLERSGLFRGVIPPRDVDERSPAPADELKSRGADHWLSGSMFRLADGTWDVRYRLWDVVGQRDVFTRAAVVSASDLRLLCHRISDEVFEAITGVKGAFATRIAYVTRSASNYALQVADSDGEDARVALNSREPIISPAWSPNGRELAYVSFETQKAVVWVQEITSGKRTKLADFRGTNSAPTWSPDGNSLAMALSREGQTQLYVMSRSGGAARRLTQSSGIDTEPVYSPDGRHLYFVSDRGGSPQIYRMPAEGGAAERITFNGSYNISPAISPDGKSMVFVSRQGGYRIALQDLASGTVSWISENSDDESPSFAPNGRMVLFASRTGTRSVLMTSSLDGKVKSRLQSASGDLREPAWGPSGR